MAAEIVLAHKVRQSQSPGEHIGRGVPRTVAPRRQCSLGSGFDRFLDNFRLDWFLRLCLADLWPGGGAGNGLQPFDCHRCQTQTREEFSCQKAPCASGIVCAQKSESAVHVGCVVVVALIDYFKYALASCEWSGCDERSECVPRNLAALC